MSVKHLSGLFVLLFPVLLFTTRVCGETCPLDPQSQRARFERDKYCHHIVAVDAHGNALMPCVSRTTAADGSFRYEATTGILAGEDTRGAVLKEGHIAEILDQSKHGDDQPMRNVLAGRETLCLYLDAIFKAIEAEQPDEVVVHIHGGLNNIHGAIEKTALICDDLETPRKPDHRIFYIGICWNSDLYPTYSEHLFSIREGLRQPGKAFVTAPAMLLSDLGGAASRLPLNLINFLYQDGYTVRPSAFKRTQLAQTRIDQILQRETERGSARSLRISPADDERSDAARKLNAAEWLVTQPTKISTTFLLDWLGSEPWKNMLRRTRTMFDRESEFIPSVTYPAARELAARLSEQRGQPVSVDKLLDQMNATGRQGAVALFCQQAQSRLTGVGKRPQITLIGHSMGSIVGCEILQRFHQLPLDNVVFMGAACSINDFKVKVVPFLQEQNLRESLRAEIAAQLGLSGKRLQTATAAATKSRFYNLCLHDGAENGEKNPGELDAVQRGSLLTWIDLLYQNPESENDRTFGRWVNAILSSDSLPGDIVDRVAIKEFGVDRSAEKHPGLETYAYRPAGGPLVEEPIHHGDFGRFAPGTKAESTNLAFWRELYRISERGVVPVPATLETPLVASTQTRRKRIRQVKPPTVPTVAVPPAGESAANREARTGF